MIGSAQARPVRGLAGRERERFAIERLLAGAEAGESAALVGDAAPGGCLESAGTWNAMVTHRVRIHAPADVDRQVRGWLEQSVRARVSEADSAP
jgi:hypothetical protein